ncbi:DNA repair protein RecN [Paucilactobacillus hokkaidonensis JCM 18461]|uniref:DNA repair protein RecN n=2 Tax=Paucilactobacillus hokkaidonensis TaxID=1193095 RepID=A0A0A1GUA6_9LACO|nr:DNA repair protein RecN [Paucilactobacillus hokkaidonensis]KRO09774.1 DNA repair protein RecN [Paucilactobacillus hokkaidonensis]BAP85560.1 DNA repair protein RecN [Paucilactobacillus hokkaidonensis JCM 18461]
MLQELTVDNLAIIDHLSLEFGTQMTVLTGETGAGKSIIIDAVSLLAGSRGSQEFIRRGSEKLNLQGQFSIPNNPAFVQLLDQLGITHEDDNVIIQREIHRSGRNTIRVNGSLVNAATLRQIGAYLVDIQGQDEHQLLMQPEQHLKLLDEYAQKKIDATFTLYRQQYTEYERVNRALKQKQSNEKQWAQRLDMLQFQVKEIEAANLQLGEDTELESERDRLNHFQQINTSLQMAATVLNGDDNGSALDSIAEAMTALQEISHFDDTYSKLSEAISSSYYALQDSATDVTRELDSLEFDDTRLDEVETRLATIADLERKYGDSVEQILDYYEKIRTELTQMQAADDDNSDLSAQLNKLEQQLEKTGTKLSQQRKKAAQQLAQDIHQQLKELYMDKAIFEVKFIDHKEQHFLPSGIDQVEFYIQTNTGESLGPLAKIASGGELSRIMLALKTIFAKSQGITSIIFDEVDTGVSGRVAQAIAEKIRLIAEHSQVLCITHLPQVAAVATHHLLIQKQVQNKRTITSVTKLSTAKRVDELARMLAGAEITKLTLEHAQELLKMAQG